jgi:hypothetical protein
VKTGDYFFLCSDGILEQISDSDLCTILAKKTDDKAKIGEIHRACQGHSKDNFSAYLIPVAEALHEEMLSETTGDDAATTLLAGDEPDILLEGQPMQNRKATGKWKTGIALFLQNGLRVLRRVLVWCTSNRQRQKTTGRTGRRRPCSCDRNREKNKACDEKLNN